VLHLWDSHEQGIRRGNPRPISLPLNASGGLEQTPSPRK
jgi:hypothetical protein